MKKFCLMFLVGIMMVLIYYGDSNLYSVFAISDIDYMDYFYDDNCQIFAISEKDIGNIIDSLNIEIVRDLRISDSHIIEGYTNKLVKYKIVCGRKVNIQISTNGDETLLGYPLINKSF